VRREDVAELRLVPAVAALRGGRRGRRSRPGVGRLGGAAAGPTASPRGEAHELLRVAQVAATAQAGLQVTYFEVHGALAEQIPPFFLPGTHEKLP